MLDVITSIENYQAKAWLVLFFVKILFKKTFESSVMWQNWNLKNFILNKCTKQDNVGPLDI